MVVNYALQTYDIASNSCFDRYCTNDKKELVHKCISSFFRSVDYAASMNLDNDHHIVVFDNGSTQETIDLINRAIQKFSSDNLKIELKQINTGSMITSIRKCYEWLRDTDGDIVYLVQDDYLFTEDAIYQMVDVYTNILTEAKHYCIIYPYNTPDHWSKQYRMRVTPRMVYPGERQYWIQCYDISCTFMTARVQLKKQWKWIEYFMSIDQVNGLNNTGALENISLNKMMVDEKVMCLMPFESVALHMQGEREKEPYIDWQKRWNSIELI